MPSSGAPHSRARALAAEVRQYCVDNANPSQADRWARYFTEGYDAWGFLDKNHPYFAEKKEEWLDRYSDLGLRGFLSAGELLLENGKYEETSMAIHFVARHRERFDAAAFEHLARWFSIGIRNWAHADVLCSEVLAPLIVSGKITMAMLAPWRESEFKYQRRAVPVALLDLLKKPFEPAPLLDFLRPLMMDSERVVHQGLGWFLREMWKKQPKPVEAFLMEWKDTAPRLIFQYATEKMTPAGRARFRKTKTKSAAIRG